MTGGAVPDVRDEAAPPAHLFAVEDEPRNTALLEAILTPAGYRLTSADRLELARVWLAGHRPDLILLDRRLPDGDGLDLCREIRADDRLRDVPVMLVTASVLPEDRTAAMDAGCDAFMMKPVRVAALLAEVERLLASR